MALPTDVQTYTPTQLTTNAVSGSGTVAKPVSTGDHTKAQFVIYNDGSGGAGAWRCTVNLQGADPSTPLRADFQLNTIVAAGDDMPTAMKRLFIAAKILLGIS